MPNIPPIRSGSVINRRNFNLRRSHTTAAEDASSEAESIRRRERRRKQDRRRNQVKVKFERRGHVRRGASSAKQASDVTVGRHINTQA